ncbi:MAG: DUF2934 domain-containing protein [Candidatus Omnitrophica bacterium]|nr:DUF2934 domain-containing protein [Candidatus Omnitrophota bacterium]
MLMRRRKTTKAPEKKMVKKPAKMSRKKNRGPQKGMLNEALLNQMIQERAYFIWEEKGKPAAQDVQIWSEAEREIRAQFS